MRLSLPLSLLITVGFLAVAQPPGMGGGGERSLVVVPMIGSGTGADPRRPGVAEHGRDGVSLRPFR